MVLYIVEECGMTCFSLAVTEGQMSIRTAEIRPYQNPFCFGRVFYHWKLCTKLQRSVFSFLLLSFWNLVYVIAVIVFLHCFTYCFTRHNNLFHPVDPPDCYFAVMEGSSSSSSPLQPSSPSRYNAQATDKPENEALPKQSEETQVTNLIGSNWPSLPSESGSPIPPGQKTKPENPSPSPWKIQQKGPEEYEKDRVGKYAEYFKDNEILPIPELLQKLEPRIVSLVVMDL